MENNVISTLEKYVVRQGAIKNIEDKVWLEKKAKQVCNAYKNKAFNFEDALKFRRLTRFGKTRLVAFFDDAFSAEFFLSNYLASAVRRTTNYKFINHHHFVDTLIESLSKIENSQDFCIVKFDFVNYYNSVATEYFYQKFLKFYNFNQTDRTLLETYISQVPYCFAGISVSNIFSELMANEFKQALSQNLKDLDLINCIRYGDDFTLIFDKQVEQTIIVETIQNTLTQVFFDKEIKVKHKNKSKIHLSGEKFAYITHQNLPFNLEYLGYILNIFENKTKLDFTLGLAPLYQNIFLSKIKKLVQEHHKNTEKLRALIKLHTRRFVYPKKSVTKQSNMFSISLTQGKKLLRKYKDKIDKKDLEFYQNAVKNAFVSLGLPLPYYLKDNNPNSGYNLLANLMRNKAFVADENIGADKTKLETIGKQLGLDGAQTLSHNELQAYLLKIIKK